MYSLQCTGYNRAQKIKRLDGRYFYNFFREVIRVLIISDKKQTMILQTATNNGKISHIFLFLPGMYKFVESFAHDIHYS